MSVFVANCPRCGAQEMTFDLLADYHVGTDYGWQWWFEAFCVCRKCHRSTVFVLSQRTETDYEIIHKLGSLVSLKVAVNTMMKNEGFINIKDIATTAPPDSLPDEIRDAFKEGATCISVECWNAAATMFRLCVDLATRPRLPALPIAPAVEPPGLNAKVRRDLGLRLPWLFDNGLLPGDLRELSACIKEDGNDGAHAGTLDKDDAEDLEDFAYALLERLYTEPERLKAAQERREKRRAK